MQDVAAADELVAGDGRVGEEDGDYAQHARGLVVPRFEQVGNGELGELARAWSDEVNQQKPGPAAGGLPQSREAVIVGVFRTAQQGARAEPAREQREHQDEGAEAAPGDEVISLGLHAANAQQRDRQEGYNDNAENDRVQCHA